MAEWITDPYSGFRFCQYIDKGKEVEGAEALLSPYPFLIVTGIGQNAETPIRYSLIERTDLQEFLAQHRRKHNTELWSVACYPVNDWAIGSERFAKLCDIESNVVMGVDTPVKQSCYRDHRLAKKYPGVAIVKI